MQKATYLLLMFFISTLAIADQGDFQRSYADAQRLIEQGSFSAAAAKLESISAIKAISDAERGKAIVLLAQAYRKDNRPQHSVEILERLSVGRGDLYWLELGEDYLALKRFDLALEAAQSYTSSKSLSLRADGAWLKARAEFGQKAYRQCVQSCESFRKYVEEARLEAEGKGEAELSHLKYFDPLLAEAKKLREAAKELYETAQYGLDFANYRKGRSAQFDGEYGKAIGYYRQVISGTLRDASTCYSADCLALNGSYKDAERAYDAFIKESPQGLYREEARLKLAELKTISSKSKSSLKDALEDVEALLSMIPNLKAQDKASTKLEGISQAIEDEIIAPAPKDAMRSDDCGNLIRNAKMPEGISNRVTSSHYLPEIEARALLMKGFLLDKLEKKQEAVEAYQKAGSIATEKKLFSDDPPVIPALLAGVSKGGYLTAEEKEARFKPQEKIATLLSYAAFLVVTERRADAWHVSEIIAVLADGKSSVESSQLKLLKAQILLFDGAKRRKEAEALLLSIYADKRLRKSSLWSTASFLYANSLTANIANKNAAFAVYKDIAQEPGSGEFAPKSLLSMALYATNTGDRKTAAGVCMEIKKSYPKTVFSQAASTLGEGLKAAKDGELLETGIATETGKVALHTRTIVLGGASKWQPDVNEMNGGDILLYNFKFVGRDSCSVIRSVWMDLPPDEPQVPPVKGNLLLFARASALFKKDL